MNNDEPVHTGDFQNNWIEFEKLFCEEKSIALPDYVQDIVNAARRKPELMARHFATLVNEQTINMMREAEESRFTPKKMLEMLLKPRSLIPLKLIINTQKQAYLKFNKKSRK